MRLSSEGKFHGKVVPKVSVSLTCFCFLFSIGTNSDWPISQENMLVRLLNLYCRMQVWFLLLLLLPLLLLPSFFRLTLYGYPGRSIEIGTTVHEYMIWLGGGSSKRVQFKKVRLYKDANEQEFTQHVCLALKLPVQVICSVAVDQPWPRHSSSSTVQ